MIMMMNKKEPEMKKTRLQYRGHCPCCGNQQAVLNNGTGTMSQHGYTVEYGWFNGVCQGHNYKPMELEREGAEHFISMVLAEVSKMEKKLDSYEAGTSHPTSIKSLFGGTKAKNIPWEEASEYLQKQTLEAEIWKLKGRIKQGKSYAQYLATLLEAVHGKPLLEINIEAEKKAHAARPKELAPEAGHAVWCNQCKKIVHPESHREFKPKHEKKMYTKEFMEAEIAKEAAKRAENPYAGKYWVLEDYPRYIAKINKMN